MECHCRGNQRPVSAKALREKLSSVSGQATAEYAIVLAAFLAVVIALGALTGVLRDGLVVSHALAAASHHVGGSLSAALDVLMF